MGGPAAPAEALLLPMPFTSLDHRLGDLSPSALAGTTLLEVTGRFNF